MKKLFKNKNFSFLLIGYILSVFIDSVIFMVAIKQMEILSNNSGSYTWLYIFNYLPAVLFSLWIGAWITAKNIAKIMKNMLLIRVVLLFLFIVIGGLSEIPIIFAFIFLEGLAAAFILPCTETLVTRIVQPSERANANALIVLLYVLVQMIGYLATTFLIKLNFQSEIILIISVLLLITAVLSLGRIKRNYILKSDVNQKVTNLIKSLFSYLKGNKNVSKLFGLFALAWLIASSIDVIIISYLTESVKVGSENYGIIAAVVSFGMIIGASISSKIYNNISVKYIFSLPLMIYTFTVFSMYMFNNWLYALPFFLMGGVSLGIFEVCLTTYLQDNNDERYYSRIFSVQSIILSSMPLPGLIFLGGLIDILGINHTILAISLFLLILSILAFNSRFTESKAIE